MFLCLAAHSQLNQAKLDSLRRSIDADTKAMQTWQDSFRKIQDSIYRDQMAKSFSVNTDNGSELLTAKKAEERRKERRLYVRLGLAVLILIVLSIALLRRRKRTNSY